MFCIILDKNKGPRQNKSSSKNNRGDDEFFMNSDGPSNPNDKHNHRSHPPHLKGRELGSIDIFC